MEAIQQILICLLSVNFMIFIFTVGSMVQDTFDSTREAGSTGADGSNI